MVLTKLPMLTRYTACWPYQRSLGSPVPIAWCTIPAALLEMLRDSSHPVNKLARGSAHGAASHSAIGSIAESLKDRLAKICLGECSEMKWLWTCGSWHSKTGIQGCSASVGLAHAKIAEDYHQEAESVRTRYLVDERLGKVSKHPGQDHG